MKASRGFSLIETMVGAAILLVVGLSVAYLAKSPGFNAGDLSNSRDACRAIAGEVLSRIKEHGSQAAVARWAPSDSNNYDTFTTDNIFENIKGSSSPLPARGGTSAAPIVGDATATTPGILNSHLLYLDSMNILTAILNDQPGTCTQAEGVSVDDLTQSFGGNVSGTSLFQDYDWIVLSPNYPRVAIHPRNLSAPGQPIDCSARSRPKPTVIPYRDAVAGMSDEFSLTQIGTPEEEVPEWGYEVQVWVRYQNKSADVGNSATEKSCQLSQIFTHKRIAPPTTQLSVVVTSNSTLRLGGSISEGSVNGALRSSGSPSSSPGNFTMDRTRDLDLAEARVQRCDADPLQTTVTATITPRRGSILYCRDRSRMRYVPPSGTTTINLPDGTYFANIVSVSPHGSASSPVSMDQLTYIRHNWAFPGGDLTCDPPECNRFPPLPLQGGNPVPGTPQGQGISTSMGGPDGVINDATTGVNYPRYFYTSSLDYSGDGSSPHRAVPPQHVDITSPYADVIQSIFGTDHERTQANGTDWGWFPCHQLATGIPSPATRRADTTLNDTSAEGCARAAGPNRTDIVLDYNPGNGQFTFEFNNLKRGCEIVVDVVEVDPARSLSAVFNDESALQAQFNQRFGRTVTTISEYVAEQSPGDDICYDEGNLGSYFFKCGGSCSGAPAETPVPEYVGPDTF